jgi:nucleoside-diphosphate-sugar epimerase
MGNVKYALFGAAGAVGKALAVKLAERGQSFRVVGRFRRTLAAGF